MENKNLIEDLFEVIKYIGDTELSQGESNAISFLLRSIKAGDSQRITTERERASIMTCRKVRGFFEKNPNKYIVIVGDVKIPQNQIFGLASYFGIKAKNLKLFLDYDKLKKDFPFEEIGNLNNTAVIFGSVPHNVIEKGDGNSPVKKSLDSLPKNAQSFKLTSGKVTKEALKKCFNEFASNLLGEKLLEMQD